MAKPTNHSLKEQLAALLTEADPVALNRQLLQAIKQKSISEVTRILKLGADPNFNHNTALRAAIIEGQLRIVQILVRYGARVDDQNQQALRVAILNNQLPIAEYLLSQGSSAEQTLEWLPEDENNENISEETRAWIRVKSDSESLHKSFNQGSFSVVEKNRKRL